MNGFRDIKYFLQVNGELCPGCWLFGCLFWALYYQFVWTSEDSKCSIDWPIVHISGGKVKTAYPRHPNLHTAKQPSGRTGKQRGGGPQNWTLAPFARVWVWALLSQMLFFCYVRTWNIMLCIAQVLGLRLIILWESQSLKQVKSLWALQGLFIKFSCRKPLNWTTLLLNMSSINQQVFLETAIWEFSEIT